MTWDEADAAIRAHIATQWAAGDFPSVPVVYPNEMASRAETFVFVSIEGAFAEKSIYGSAGKRSSVEGGIVYFHAFTPVGSTDATATQLVVAMTAALELQTITGGIALEGGKPPTPAEIGDAAAPGQQPRGNYYRCSGSVPFIVIGAR